MLTGFDHVQIAIPATSSELCRQFYAGLLALEEVPRPDELMSREGFWLNGPGVNIHFGVDPNFTPAKKAHLAFRVADLDGLAVRLEAEGLPVNWDTVIPTVRRLFTEDPVGNRLELIQDAAA
ncbi:MAG: glyoxalase [Rhodobacteraceae bacterium]|nr:glyoxalase [Paracoccaceae bacterium]